MFSIIGEKGLTGIVKRMLDLVLIGGAGIILSLPVSLKWYFNTIYRINNESYGFLMGFLYVTGVLCLVIVYEMRKIFKTINKRDPFIAENVRSLKRMAVASFAIAICYIVKIFLFNSFLTIIIAMIFTIAGLFTIILAELFRQAVQYKEENDLTI